MINHADDTPPVPSLRTAFTGGLEHVTNHWWLVIIPLILDLFLWLGPQVTIDTLILGWLDQLPTPLPAEMMAQINEVAPQFNLFSFLSLPIIGVPSLIATTLMQPPPIPLTNWPLSNGFEFAAYALLFSLGGTLLTTSYYAVISQTILRPYEPFWSLSEKRAAGSNRFVRNLPLYWFRFIWLVLGGFLLLFIIYLLALPLLIVAVLIHPALTWFVGMLMLTAMLFAIILLSFTPHGLLMHYRTLDTAVRESFFIVRQYRQETINLVLIIFIVNTLSKNVWRYADTGSWLTITSIIGHSFITTAMVAASFIFYHQCFHAAGLTPPEELPVPPPRP
ncbi:MAG TPA: hypothetical protein VLL52_14355 [Anaerolineae bacterium]|nr:hypothetical protein [Anaerolineae bacterium]